MAQAYTVEGGRFCHQQAGENVVSANLNNIEHLKWKLFKSVAIQSASFIRGMEKEIAIIFIFRIQKITQLPIIIPQL